MLHIQQYFISLIIGITVATIILTLTFTLQDIDEEERNADDISTEHIPLSYITPHSDTPGKQFQISKKTLEIIGIPPRQFIQFTPKLLEHIPFVTASDYTHFEESFGWVGSLQTHRPEAKIIYYDLGLYPHQAKKVKKMCGVEYVKFNFHLYPEHVRKLAEYHFKPLVIWEVLRKYGGAFWGDSSIRMHTGNVSLLLPDIIRANGIMQFRGTPGSIYSYTHPGMFKYLPGNVTAFQLLHQYAAGYMLLFNTEEVYWNILHWWILCALEERCFAPKGHSNYCKNSICKKNYTVDMFCGCHRYDQSAINILLNNDANYTSKHQSKRNLFGTQRRPSKKYFPQYCS